MLPRLKPGATDGTALGNWLNGNVTSVAVEDVSLLEVLPMNSEQRESDLRLNNFYLSKVIINII